MIDSQMRAYPGGYTGYIKWSGRHGAWVARLVYNPTGRAVVAMNHATPEDAQRWLETLAAQLHRERQEGHQ